MRATHLSTTATTALLAIAAAACAPLIGLEEGVPLEDGPGTGSAGSSATSSSTGAGGTGSTSTTTSSNGGGTGGDGGGGQGGDGGGTPAPFPTVSIFPDGSIVDIARRASDGDGLLVLAAQGNDPLAGCAPGDRPRLLLAEIVPGDVAGCMARATIAGPTTAPIELAGHGIDVHHGFDGLVALGGRAVGPITAQVGGSEATLENEDAVLFAAWIDVGSATLTSSMTIPIVNGRSIPSWSPQPFAFGHLPATSSPKSIPCGSGVATFQGGTPGLENHPFATSPRGTECPGPLVEPVLQAGEALDVAANDDGVLMVRTAPDDVLMLVADDVVEGGGRPEPLSLGTAVGGPSGNVVAVDGGFLVASALDASAGGCAGTPAQAETAFAARATILGSEEPPLLTCEAFDVASYRRAVAGLDRGDTFVLALLASDGSWVLAEVVPDLGIVTTRDLCTRCDVTRLEATASEAWILGTVDDDGIVLDGEPADGRSSFLVHLPLADLFGAGAGVSP